MSGDRGRFSWARSPSGGRGGSTSIASSSQPGVFHPPNGGAPASTAPPAGPPTTDEPPAAASAAATGVDSVADVRAAVATPIMLPSPATTVAGECCAGLSPPTAAGCRGCGVATAAAAGNCADGDGFVVPRVAVEGGRGEGVCGSITVGGYERVGEGEGRVGGEGGGDGEEGGDAIVGKRWRWSGRGRGGGRRAARRANDAEGVGSEVVGGLTWRRKGRRRRPSLPARGKTQEATTEAAPKARRGDAQWRDQTMTAGTGRVRVQLAGRSRAGPL